MTRRALGRIAAALCVAAAVLYAAAGSAATGGGTISLGGVNAVLSGAGGREEVALAVRIVIGLTVLSLAPALLMSMTSFIRIVIVLSMLRHALGMQETPPNTVLISLALFLTLFTMAPVFEQVNAQSFTPFMNGKLSSERALDEGMKPLRGFMIRQTREQDFSLMVELSRKDMPQSAEEIGNAQLIPAFMLSELRSAFQIGFVIFLPFLLIDLVVSSILMSLGMMMVPPATIALPIKILMFILIDGWNLVIRSLIGTFQ
jgi:flagellar biosynthesis protein FliP